MLLFNPVSLVFMSVGVHLLHIRMNEAELREPEVYEPVARRLALYCQSAPQHFPKYIQTAWIPPEVARLAPHARGVVETRYAGLELGGGFYHYGYRLELDPAASTQDANVWHLSVYREYEQGERLFTVRLSPKESLSADELASLVIAGHDEQLDRNPADADAHKRKIQSYLQLGKVALARRACADMAARLPDDWWANVVNALVLVEDQGPAAGEKAMRAWVERRPSYFTYLDLAYFFQLQRLHEKAAEAALEAMRQTTTALDPPYDAQDRGFTAAKYVYDTGHYDTALRLCDHILSNPGHAAESLRRLRYAAERARQGEVTPVDWGSARPFDPFAQSFNLADASVDIDALLGRKLDRPTDEGAR